MRKNIQSCRVWGVLALCIFIFGCSQNKSPEKIGLENPDHLRHALKNLTSVMVHDIFSPVVASRIYTYTSIASYEAIAANSSEFKSLAGQVNELEPIPKANDSEISLELASLHAFIETGKTLVFSTNRIDAFQDSLYKNFKAKGLSRSAFKKSIAYGDQVSAHILGWAAKDNYKETRGVEKYTVTDEPGRWVPTPPAYQSAVEPNWNKIRPMVMKSSDQFKPIPPIPYSMEKDSDFYKQVYDVYETTTNLSEEQIEIAKFWDCNPFATQIRGHFMFSIKKLTPGGHWMSIASLVAKKDGANFGETTEAFAFTSMALFDGFISNWDEKFRSNLIRPETLINKHIDADWKPLLQTPPFPEYPSGHSTISRAAAEVLTDLFGDNFYFEDSTELDYGLPVRTFNSFIEAANEAAVSRIYGGIHYQMAADLGIIQGREVGRYIISQVETRNTSIAEGKDKK